MNTETTEFEDFKQTRMQQTRGSLACVDWHAFQLDGNQIFAHTCMLHRLCCSFQLGNIAPCCEGTRMEPPSAT
eukprot:204256-Amphidinium_carterae.2